MLVDDHTLVRSGIKLLLEDLTNVQIISEVSTGEDAIRCVRDLAPDLVLMDIDMPGIGGLEATRRLLRIMPELKIVILTGYNEPFLSSRLLQIGAAGYLTKNINKQEMYQAIEAVTGGKRYICSLIANAIALSKLEEKNPSPFMSLSERELQILLMILRGAGVKDISDQLHLSPKTVNSYRYSMFKKLGVKGDVDMTLLAIKYGLLANWEGKGSE
jgi:two-component system invasion response regulator UvrY